MNVLLRAMLLLLSHPIPDTLALTLAIADGIYKEIVNELSTFSITFMHGSHKNMSFHSIFLDANSVFWFCNQAERPKGVVMGFITFSADSSYGPGPTHVES